MCTISQANAYIKCERNHLRSSEDQIAGQKRRALGQERDGLTHVENHILGRRRLNSLTIQLGRDLESIGVTNQISSHNTRTERCPAIEALSKGPLSTTTLDLPLPMRDFVTNGVPEDVVQGLALGDVFGLLADNNHQFTLVVNSFNLLRHIRNGDVVVGACNRVDGLVEQYRVLGQRKVGFMRMLCVVQAQSANRGDILPGQRRQKRPHFGNLVCNFMLAEDITFDHLGRGSFADIADAAGEDGIAIVDLAVLGQESNETLLCN